MTEEVIDGECPHGLDPAWCTFCLKKAAPAARPAVRRTTASATARPAKRAAPAGTGSGRAPAAPRGPADGLVKLRKVLFHASAYGAWPSIAESGLLPTSELLRDDPRLNASRAGPIGVVLPSGQEASVRDQRPMMRAGIEGHLDGIELGEWLGILNERSFLFARQKDLMTFLGRYQETGQDVLVFDTARLLAAAKGRTEVTTVSSTAPVAWEKCPCRNRDTFEPIDSFSGDLADICEVTIVGGIENIAGTVVRVMRHHPDHTTEVLVA